MNINYKYYIIIFSYFGILSCNSPESIEDKGESISLRIQNNLSFSYDTIFIPIDSLTKPAFAVNYFDEEQENVVFYNDYKHSLQFFSLNNKILEDEIKLEKEGPNSVFIVSAIFVHNKDSIFLATENPKREVLLINDSGNVLERWYVKDKINGLAAYDLYIGTCFKMNFNKNKNELILSQAPYLEPHKLECYNYPYVFAFSLDSAKIVSTYGEFPLKDDIYYYLEEVSRTRFHDYEIVQFAGVHNLQVYDYHNKTFLFELQSKSQFFPERIPPFGKDKTENGTMEEHSEYYYMNARYQQISSTNSDIVRFNKLPNNDPEGRNYDFDDFKYSLQIINIDDKTIVERLLEGFLLEKDLVFTSKNDIYISLNNPKNKDFDESSIVLLKISYEKN